MESASNVKHVGSCHCGQVRFEVWASKDLDIYDCNCSICYIKQNQHFIVPEKNFKLLQGEEYLTCYTFNTHQAKHTFCSRCGVQSFYTPRSNPDGRGINYRCLDPGTINSVNIIPFDGQNWETTIERDPSIKNHSK